MMRESGSPSATSYLGGVEKEYVRKHSWYRLLKERRERTGERIRYLTMPGRQITELRELVAESIIEGPADLILVERDILDYHAILRDAPLLPYHCPVEPIAVMHGDVNALIIGSKLDSYLPVDAVNLDYCGFIWGTETMISQKWAAVKHLIRVQSQNTGGGARPFTLLLTVQGRGDAKAFVDDALHEYKEDVGDQWSVIAQYPYHGKLAYALPLMITHAGFTSGYDVCCTHRYVYRPISVGGSATMLSFGFTFDLPPAMGEATSRMKARAALEAV